MTKVTTNLNHFPPHYSKMTTGGTHSRCVTTSYDGVPEPLLSHAHSGAQRVGHVMSLGYGATLILVKSQ